MELSPNYYMTKENRTFNLYFDTKLTSFVFRFRGAASSSLGSFTLRGPIVTTWTGAN